MKKFEIFPHTADIGIRVYGRNLKELFENSGEGTLFLMREEENLQEKEEINFEIKSDFIEMLLNKFLNEFIYLFDSKFFLIKNFKIEEFSENIIKGKLFGETFDEKKHKIKYAIKACTLEDMIIEKVDNLYKVDIIFDI
ncbi:MAG: archease [Caldisericia bacterium]|jgi:SHS2 domain-containing protein|nr:archease [Caldisericia bacterium]